MRILKGKITDSKGQSTYNARVYLTSKTGKRLYDNKYDARSDADGKYSISLPPELFRTERWIRVTDPTTAAYNGAKIKSHTDVYDFRNSDKGENAQALEEVNIKRDSSKTACEKKGGTYNPQTKECTTKKKWGLYAILGGVGLLAIGLIIYGARQKQ